MFKRAGLPHNVLNAKYHQREAEIVAGAGQPGARHHRDEHGRPRNGHQTRAGRHGIEAVTGEGSGQQGHRCDRGRRPAHHRLRASRVAAHRSAAARPLRSSGRSGRVAVLPVARRRPDAPLRVGAHREADGPDGRAGGRGAHAPAHHALDRAGAEARRAAELPVAQAAAGLRRRHEPAARGDLLAAVVRARGWRRAQGRSAQDGRQGAYHAASTTGWARRTRTRTGICHSSGRRC